MGVLIHDEPMLRINRHPILIDHETQVVLDLRPGESLYSFLHRHIENVDGHPMEVSIGGKSVQKEMWTNVYPKGNHTIMVRFGVQKSALAVVALVALSVFTMGAAAAVAAGAGATGIGAGFAAGMAAAGLSATASMAVIGAIQVVGAMLINKVLGPKVPSASAIERDSVYNAGGARNNVRQYEPFGLLLGSVRVTPDVISIPYTQYINNDQYMGEVFSPGINVNRFDTLYVGDSPLANFEGVQIWTAGFQGMPQQTIPLFTNVDTIGGGTLEADFAPGPWIERVSSADVMRLQVDISYLLFDLTSKGKKKNNQERIQIQYKPVGTTNWLNGPQPYIVSQEQTEGRRTYGWDVAPGQYDVRVRRMGQDTDGSGATAEFNFAALVSIQRDTATYKGISRIGLQVKATGQLNSALDEVRAVMHANPMPMWDGNAWATATDRSNGLSNPGAQILQYVRGFRDEDGVLIAGMGLPDSQIDIESFKSFMTHCRVNNFTYNQWITDARSHDEIISSIALAGMGRYTWAPGRLTLVWAAEGQGHEGVAGMGNITKGEFQVDYSLAQAADGIEYTYVDGTTWETKTLRVPAPGVTIMTNPARLTGEGIDNEEHAVTLARYHLAQSIYQFKDIVFGMGIEHLAFGQMSMIQLSHDLTQWGFSGRVMVAGRDAQNRVVLKFDEPVPGPTNNQSAYVGLRVAGEANYRVFRILAFAGYSDTVTLVDPWPADAQFPGNTEQNPAWNTLYMYDFKQTPGLRCRVTGISPGDDLNGASISVVPESDEFWNYVKTGEYIPPKNESLLRPRPVVSNLRVREERVVQGDTVFSMLNANWRISGYAQYVIVTCGKEGELPVEVARTSALSATWRVEDPGRYIITVRPYDGKDMPGDAQVVVQDVLGAVLPPVNPDLFFITEIDGGLRKYSWGWLANTIQSPDFAGVEVRYVAGTVSQPTWATMTPLGNNGDGYHTTAFESANPPSGPWTFAVRAVNTSGVIATEMLVVQRVLSKNLGQVIGDINDGIDENTAYLIELERQLQLEKTERFNEDTRVAQEAADDATAKANQARADAMAQIDALSAIVNDLVNAPEWDAVTEYIVGSNVKYDGKLYVSLTENVNSQPDTNPADWQLVGSFSSTGEALAAVIALANQNATDISAQATRVDGVIARLPAGNGAVASVEQLDQVTVRVEETEQGLVATGQRITSLRAETVGEYTGDEEGGVGNPGGATAVISVASVAADETRAVAKRVDIVQAEFGEFEASVTQTFESIATEFDAQAQLITDVRVDLGEDIASSNQQLNARIDITDGNVVAVAQQINDVKVEVEGNLAEAISGLEAQVEVNEQGIATIKSRAFLRVIADAGLGPLIGGMEINNDGLLIATRFQSDIFEVVSPDTGQGFEIRNGFIRIWRGVTQNIIGNGFGVAGDNLIEYFGPNVGADNASKAIAKTWKDSNGNAYWGGTLAAGILLNAVQATTIQTIGVNLVNGPFDTNGNNKNVVVSFTRDVQLVKRSSGSSGFVAGGGSNTATINIYRQIENQPETLWRVLNAAGSVDIFNQLDGDDTASLNWAGSITVNDAADGSARRTYRAEIVGFTAQTVTHSSGSFDDQTIRQNLSIVSTEV